MSSSTQGLRPFHGLVVLFAIVAAVIVAFWGFSFIVGVVAATIKVVIVVAIIALVVKLVFKHAKS